MNGVFFDLGKTLLDNYGYDTVDALHALYNKTDKNIEFSILYEEYKKYHKQEFGKAKEDLSEVVLGDFLYNLLKVIGLNTNLSSEELEEVFFFEFVKNEGILKEAKLILEYFKNKNYIIIAVSNSCISSKNLLKGMNNLDIGKYFNEVISSSDIRIRKPRKEIFDVAIERMKSYNVDKCNMLFIGNDYICDMQGSFEVGLRNVWFNEYKAPDTNNYVTFNVSSYKDLIELLENND